MQLLITCPFGLVSLLSKELKKLGYTAKETFSTALMLETDLEGLYRINLWSRIANKVYLILGQGEILDFDQLFDKVGSLSWREYISDFNTLSVQVSTKDSLLSFGRSIQSVAHKAILNSLGDFSSSRSGISEVFLYLEKNQMSICVNTSGPSLHQRGWRKQTGIAPLKENIAAAIVLFTGWRFKSPLRDPCCGSGTILIEAAMIAKNIAPGMQRNFAFQSFATFDAELRGTLVEEATSKIYQQNYLLYGSDQDATLLQIAQENALRAGVSESIQRTEGKFEEQQTPFSEQFRLISNPPYGKRIGSEEDLAPLYESLLQTISVHQGGIISSYPGLKQLFSSKEFSHKSLYNGADLVDFYRKKPC